MQRKLLRQCCAMSGKPRWNFTDGLLAPTASCRIMSIFSAPMVNVEPRSLCLSESGKSGRPRNSSDLPDLKGRFGRKVISIIFCDLPKAIPKNGNTSGTILFGSDWLRSVKIGLFLGIFIICSRGRWPRGLGWKHGRSPTAPTEGRRQKA